MFLGCKCILKKNISENNLLHHETFKMHHCDCTSPDEEILQELYPNLFIHNSTPMRPCKLCYGEKVKSCAWKWDTWQSMKASWLHKNKPSVCASTRAKRVWQVEPISSWHAAQSDNPQTGLSCHCRQWASIKLLKQKRTFFSFVPFRGLLRGDVVVCYKQVLRREAWRQLPPSVNNKSKQTYLPLQVQDKYRRRRHAWRWRGENPSEEARERERKKISGSTEEYGSFEWINTGSHHPPSSPLLHSPQPSR